MRWVAAPIVLLLLLAGCRSGGESPGSLEPPKTPEETAERFLSHWQAKEYDAMYDLVAAGARATISREQFVGRYEAIAEEATITAIEFEIGPRASGDAIAVEATVVIHTAFFGDIVQAKEVPLVREVVTAAASPGTERETSAEWRVQWTPSLIFNELDDRSLVHFFADIPRRGGIYDRNGQPLALSADLPVIGIVPDLIGDKEAVIAALSSALALPASEVRSKVETTLPSYYFIPVKTLPYGTPPEAVVPFYEMDDLGVVVREETVRVYPNGSLAAHVLGYLAEVSAEQLAELRLKGFREGDRLGASGLEGQLDAVLAGERGGRLATVTPEGTIARTIAEKPPALGKDVFLSIDVNVQKTAEAALGERVGSIVVMEPHDNSVLALASFPRFDPNAFVRGLTAAEFDALVNDPRQPFLHRPLLATYPPGSTFKVVTAAAGLERAGIGPSSTFHCLPVWDRLGEEFKKNNWQSVDRGWLTVSQGLMASCNPVFYDIAVELDGVDPDILPEFALAFGYGRPTGINGLDEAPGVVPGPAWKEREKGEPWYTGDSVNMAIGQGFMAVTPLQIANAYAAIADGALLRKPLLVRRIVQPGGAVAQEFAAETIGPLPVSQSTIDAIRHGLTLVTQNPGGTSYQIFAGASVDAAGKSGTAEDLAFGSDHVFFVAYANRSDPSIVALAALEEGESGSREAGPMVRRILEAYLSSLVAAAGGARPP